ncbi:hypothetical protein JUN65_02035 [Gluconacetobacter azotocaptans]|uniref:phage protease n=1 Tax=Gluconacetobacter azotocaptans TaxID=142834 RepID=UPI001958201A|nr:phage protease [Gluconacetobacter azotocaptans]MBM9400373.1 hypothetical protein [Gluconacetobacter azotocaptans]
MTQISYHTALPSATDGTVPEWVHLVPAGRFTGDDGRGPFEVRDPQAVIRNSMTNGRLVLDENHATDLATRNGASGRASGWIVELQTRSDGIWGRVEWTRHGRELMTDKAYRDISPVFHSDPSGVIDRIFSAALTNGPNLTLNHLHTRQEPRMDLAELRRRLGLPESATQEDVDRALDAARGGVSLHSRLAQVAGLDGNASADAIAAAVRARIEGGTSATRIEELQRELDTVRANASRAEATALLDRAAAEGKIITQEMRDELVTLHTTSPGAVGKIIAGLPVVPRAPKQLHTRQAPTTEIDGVIKDLSRRFGSDPAKVRAEYDAMMESGDAGF